MKKLLIPLLFLLGILAAFTSYELLRRDIGARTDDGSWYAAEVHRSYVYPSNAEGKKLVSSATPYAAPADYTVIIPINTVTSPYSVTNVLFEGLSAAGIYELTLYSSSTGAVTEIGRTKVVSKSAVGQNIMMPIGTDIVSANQGLIAKITSSVASARATSSVMYLKY